MAAEVFFESIDLTAFFKLSGVIFRIFPLGLASILLNDLRLVCFEQFVKLWLELFFTSLISLA